MPVPTETALKGRARTLLLAMTERSRWVYAIPPDQDALVRPILEASGLACVEADAEAKVARFATDDGATSFVVWPSPELEVTLIEAAGDGAAPILARVLEKTSFYAQSRLLGTAIDVREPEAPKALRTLAHMVVAWDEDWSDLFLLHLASPDPVVRNDAVAATCVAAMVARDAGPAIALLEEAERREKFPKLKETIGEAMAVIRAALGGPVEVAPD